MRLFALTVIGTFGLALLLAACGGGDGDDVSDGQTVTPENTPSREITPEIPFSEACEKSDEKQFSQAPPRIIDTTKAYVATISTEKGDIVVELFSDTPITTNNFVFLACKGFYDGLTFHRVEPDFVIQGGDPEGTGTGGPGYSIPDEDDGDHQMELGVISMAKSGPDTTGSQFFVVTGPRASVQHLDPDFTVFGRVTEGMDVAQEIAVGDVMQTVSIEER